MKTTASISFHVGGEDVSNLDHNDRTQEYLPEHIQSSMSNDNVTLVNRTLSNVYHEKFDEALKEYNEKQIQKGHKERVIDDYLEHVNKDKKKNNRMEAIVQIGTHDDDISAELKRDMLVDWFQDFEERNPNLAVVQAIIHCDETEDGRSISPHMHLVYVPTANMKTGLSLGVSNKEAYRQMLDEDKKVPNNVVFEKWRNREVDALAEIMEEHDIERKVVGSHKHLNVKEFQIMQDKIKDIENDLKFEEEKNEQLRAENRAINNHLKKVQSIASDLQTEVNDYKKEISELNREAIKSTQEAEEAKELAEEMEEKAKSIIDNVNVSTTIEDKKLYTKRDIEAFKENERNLNVALNLKDEEIRERDKTIEDIKQQKYEVESENYELKQELKSKDKIIQSLNEKVDYFKCRLSGIEAVADTLEVSQFRAIFLGAYTADIGKAIQVNNTQLFRDCIEKVAKDADIEISESMKERINDTCNLMQKRKANNNKEEYNQIDVEYSETISDIKRFENQAEQSQKRLNETNFNVLCEALSVYDIDESKKEEIVTEALKSNKDIKVEDVQEFVEGKYAIVDEDAVKTKYKNKQLDDAVFKKVEIEDFKENYHSNIAYKTGERVFEKEVASEYVNLVDSNVNIESNKVSQRIKIEEMETLRKKRQELEEEEYRINKMKQEHEKESNRSRGRERSL